MLRSMFSAVSGLRAHQTMMDVTGNNVANVNTAGFKASRTTFQETLTQMTRAGTAPGVQGGVNPMQLGLGARVGATDGVFTQGASQVTGRATDVAIQGDGFFRVDLGGENFYMRAGAFSLDAEGTLVAPGGERIQGWSANPPGPNAAPVGVGDEGALGRITIDPQTYTDVAIGQDGTVTARTEAGELHTIGQLALSRFANPGGLERVGNGMFRPSPNAGAEVLGTPGGQGLGSLQSGTLEMSNVDLAQEFTNLILSQRGFQANSRTITTSDELLQELVNLKR